MLLLLYHEEGSAGKCDFCFVLERRNKKIATAMVVLMIMIMMMMIDRGVRMIVRREPNGNSKMDMMSVVVVVDIRATDQCHGRLV